MAWTQPPKTWISGELVTAGASGGLNVQLRDQLIALAAGHTEIASGAAGDVLYLSDANTVARLAKDAGKFLKSGASAVSWDTVAAAAGSDTQVQFNDGGTAFGGDAGLTFNSSTNVLSVGSGVGFPATQSAAAGANVLDDYEEGTWTPVIGGTGGQSGQAYSAQVGRYIKIGGIVYLTAHVILSTEGTITGDCQISGFPFTSANTTNQAASSQIGTFYSTNQAAYQWAIRHEPNTAVAVLLLLMYSGDGSLLTENNVSATAARLDDDTGFTFNHFYFVV